MSTVASAYESLILVPDIKKGRPPPPMNHVFMSDHLLTGLEVCRYTCGLLTSAHVNCCSNQGSDNQVNRADKIRVFPTNAAKEHALIELFLYG